MKILYKEVIGCKACPFYRYRNMLEVNASKIPAISFRCTDLNIDRAMWDDDQDYVIHECKL